MRLVESTQILGRVPVTLHELDNGLRVVVSEVGTKPIAAVQVWYGVGSADEEPGKTGLAHFLEHLMFKGTERFPEGVFDRTLERLGGDTNAATWLDWTYYKVKVPAEHVATVLDLEADRMRHLRIGAAGFASEKDVVKNERLLRVENDPNGFAEERFFDLFFTDHPYGQPTIGWMKDIEGLTLDDVLGFYDRHYAPANAVVSIAGGIDPAQVLEATRAAFGAFEPGVRRDRRRLARRVARRERTRDDLSLPVEQARLLVGYPSPRKYTRASVAGALISEVLLGARSSALHRRTVTEEELAVYASGWHGALQQPSVFQLEWLLADPRVEGRVIEILAEEVARVSHGGLGEDEVEGARNRIRMGMLGSLQSAEAVAGMVGEMVLLEEAPTWIDRASAILDEVGTDDLAAHARQHLDEARRLVVAVQPRASAEDAP